eukprot:4654085-Pyramimonas_sp.AAC.1
MLSGAAVRFGTMSKSNPTWSHACTQYSQVNVAQTHHMVGGVLDVKSGQPESKFARAMDPRVFVK